MKKFVKIMQVIMTTLIVVLLGLEIIRYLNDNVTETIVGYLVIGIIVFWMSFMISFAVVFTKNKVRGNKNITIWVIVVCIEFILLGMICGGIEDKIELRQFKESGYNETTATVTDIKERTKTVRSTVDDTYSEETVYSVTWTYNETYEKVESYDYDSYKIGDTKTIYYSLKNPNWARWSVNDSLTGIYITTILLLSIHTLNCIKIAPKSNEEED